MSSISLELTLGFGTMTTTGSWGWSLWGRVVTAYQWCNTKFGVWDTMHLVMLVNTDVNDAVHTPPTTLHTPNLAQAPLSFVDPGDSILFGEELVVLERKCR